MNKTMSISELMRKFWNAPPDSRWSAAHAQAVLNRSPSWFSQAKNEGAITVGADGLYSQRDIAALLDARHRVSSRPRRIAA
jgi:hypothetical protein